MMENNSEEELRKFIKTNYKGQRVLDLNGRKLSKVPEAVTDLTDVEELDLSDNNLTELPTSINKLKNLEVLRLDNNQLSELPETVCELINLTWLDVSDNKLSVLPTHFSHLKKLRRLYSRLRGQQITLTSQTCPHHQEKEK